MQRMVAPRLAAWTVTSPLAIGLITVLLLGASIGLAIYSDALARDAGTRQAVSQAAILSRSLAGSIAFDDVAATREYIEAVKADPATQAVGAYNADGDLIAGFARGGVELPASSRTSGVRNADGRIEVRRAVIQSETTMGYVFLANQPTSQNQRLLRLTGVAAAAALSTMLGLVLVASVAALANTNRRLLSEMETRKAAEEELAQARKMEAMGQLTGGVAHDFNNLLTPIVATLDRLQRKDVIGPRERRLIDAAAQSADRARILVQRLLAFARRQPLQSKPTDIAELLLGIQGLLTSTVGPSIIINVDIAQGLPPVFVDPNQLEMALLNLAVNARDAMEEGGQLTVSSTLEEIRTSEVADLVAGKYVKVRVADTGSGMSEDTLARAVEPFFSTKGVGKGTGLGLSMVHGLVKQLSGGLSIASRIGEGTKIDLYLPISGEIVQDATVTERAAVRFQRMHHVLLVDDDGLVRGAIAEVLSEAGLRVDEADTAIAGLARLKDGLRPDIIVTDHLMPGMTGADLAVAVRDLYPGVPVIVVSGYAEHEGLPAGLVRLNKPLQRDELLHAIDRLCSSNPGTSDDT